MKPLEDDDLILYLYGESEDPESVRRQIESSEELRARCETLRLVLAAVDAAPVPERGGSYGAEVWARLEPRLAEERRGGRLLAFRRLIPSRPWQATAGWAAAALVLLAVGFTLGRLWPRPEALPQEARDRILLATVGAHLERSERLIAEVANAPGPMDFSAERAWARDLLAANRLYRQSVRQAGRPRLAVVLDDLEPFLLDLAHASAEPPEEEIAAIQERIASQALLFKVRVASDRLDPRKQTL